ncbi:hypothetical protein [Rhodovulum sp. BSW8]|uniref:hypothetical protein n=1 Tax=Rhodovulum sp. BSW8 TaxID=2259645 RepID=UPI00105911A0|nr:hypothetical protein [Rhodovulum sp. BSW8]
MAGILEIEIVRSTDIERFVSNHLLDGLLPPRRGWGWGWRRLPRYKVIGQRRFQLHATRGWKCIGRTGR